MPTNAILKKELFQFLVELKFNNERAWFLANKPRYEEILKKPMLSLINAVQPRLQKINPAYTLARLLRIFRDLRFAKDKTPYKTNAAAQFSHRASGGDAHTPGIYLHLEPGESFVMAGIWQPDSSAIKRIRAAIQARPGDWAPLSKLPPWGDSYVRPPKGVDAGHKFIKDLKRKHFLTWVDFKDRDVFAADFVARIEKACKHMNPLLVFLTRALGLK